MAFFHIKRIHFIGIGGIGMSGVAELLLHSGYSVSGSDLRKTAITERLEQRGAKIFYKHAPENLENVQVVVVSSAIAKDNPELLAAFEQRIPVVHRTEMLAELMRMKYGVLVAGTHGKTTTTSMLITALKAVGLDPTGFVGGCLSALGGSNACLGEGDLFIAEADESDGSFLQLVPSIAVVTNIDRDHMEHYGSFDSILEAFLLFVQKIPFYGALCACIDDPGVQLLLPKVRKRVITFGLRSDADVTARDIEIRGFSTRFTPVVYGQSYPSVTLNIPGRHNVSNALASFAVAAFLGQDLYRIAEGLNAFSGVLHRCTQVGTWNNYIFIDDYAHNPRKIASLLRALREAFPDYFLYAVFQPHRYTRLKFLGDEFARSFSDADAVLMTPIYSAGEQPDASVSLENLAQAIRQHSFYQTQGEIALAQNFADAAEKIAGHLKQNPHKKGLIVTLGAGDIPQLHGMILDKLKSI